MRKDPYVVFGFDLGIASVGFSVIDTANEEVLWCHSHLFDAPQNPKDKVSLAAVRRGHRSTRRNIKREADRKKHVFALLKEIGLVADDSVASSLQTRAGDVDTLAVRAEGLDRRLTDRELAQFLYYFCGHRGYIPHGEGAGGDAEGRKVLSAVSKNAELLTDGEWRTVGEMLRKTKSRSRNRAGSYELCVSCDLVAAEIKAVVDAQVRLGNHKVADDFCDRYLETLYWEAPVEAKDAASWSKVGRCLYWREGSGTQDAVLRRAAKSDLVSQQVEALERLCHVRVIGADGVESPLPANVVLNACDLVFNPDGSKKKVKSISYRRLRKLASMDSAASFKGVPEDKEKRAIVEPRPWNTMVENLSKELVAKLWENPRLCEWVTEALTYGSSGSSVESRLESFWGPGGEAEALGAQRLSAQEIQEILSLPFSSPLFNGYGRRSRYALNLLHDGFISSLEMGCVPSLVEVEAECVTDDGQTLADLRHEMRTASGPLLAPYRTWDPDCENPTVLRAMGQLRKVINACIKRWGSPSEVHLELARELKMSKARQADVLRNQKRRTEQREKAREEAAEILGVGIDRVSGKTITKYIMYIEQGGKDPYTGEGLDVKRVLADPSYAEIDHVLPYSRTADDSRNNKVLVTATSNREKGNRTPYEWMVEGEGPLWEDYAARISRDTHFKSIPGLKDKLLRRELGSMEGFIARNLQDTSYMARKAAMWIEECLEFAPSTRKRHVVPVSGRMTAIARRQWGLNTGPANTKDRSDERHHATDAAVIAGLSTAMVQRMARASGRETPIEAVEPWPGFSGQVITEVDKDVPTKAVVKKTTGELFEQTRYRFNGVDEKGRGLLEAKGKERPVGNYHRLDDKTAVVVGDQAFLQIWHDPDVKNGKGRFYLEPVYKADVNDVLEGSIEHRYIKAHTGRKAWPLVPETALGNAPIRVYPNDVLVLGSAVGRYVTVNISSGAICMADLWTNEKADYALVSKLSRRADVDVIHQDVLGEGLRSVSKS